MLKLKLQYFGHLRRRTDYWLRKDADAVKDWRQEEKGMRGWDGWMASLTQWTWVWASFRSRWWTGKPGVLESMELQRVGYDWGTELNDKIENSGNHLKSANLNIPIWCKLECIDGKCRTWLKSYVVCAWLVSQSCLTYCNPMNCSLPGSSVHGVFSSKDPRVGSHCFLQGIFPTQGLNLSLLLCR